MTNSIILSIVSCIITTIASYYLFQKKYKFKKNQQQIDEIIKISDNIIHAYDYKTICSQCSMLMTRTTRYSVGKQHLLLINKQIEKLITNIKSNPDNLTENKEKLVCFITSFLENEKINILHRERANMYYRTINICYLFAFFIGVFLLCTMSEKELYNIKTYYSITPYDLTPCEIPKNSSEGLDYIKNTLIIFRFITCTMQMYYIYFMLFVCKKCINYFARKRRYKHFSQFSPIIAYLIITFSTLSVTYYKHLLYASVVPLSERIGVVETFLNSIFLLEFISIISGCIYLILAYQEISRCREILSSTYRHN